MQNAVKLALVVGAIACFGAGATVSYSVAAKPAIEWAETQPFYIFAEQTHILKSLRNGEEKQITDMLEEVVWMQISVHAARILEGRAPPAGLQDHIAYHCGQQRSVPSKLDQDIQRTRIGWCSALKA